MVVANGLKLYLGVFFSPLSFKQINVGVHICSSSISFLLYFHCICQNFNYSVFRSLKMYPVHLPEFPKCSMNFESDIEIIFYVTLCKLFSVSDQSRTG